MRIADAQELPPTLSAREAAELFGVHYETLLATVRSGECPVAPLKLGRRLRWPTIRVLDAVGIAHGGIAHGHRNDEGPGTTPGLANNVTSIAIPDDDDHST